VPTVDVCLCTFRRSGVVDTLRSLAAQRLPPDIAMRVVVADNDDMPSARDRVVAAAEAAGLSLHYVHAPARNISIARNACLDAAMAPLIAFIDDDELAPPGWLAALLLGMQASGAPIVLGPVQAHYGGDLPRWLAAADLHSTTPAIRADGTIDTGYSCNVLFRRGIVKTARFDPALGRTGGEDDVFFSGLFRDGHRIAFARDAQLIEIVPPTRASLRWLIRRWFRNGQTYAAIRLDAGDRPAGLAMRAGAKAIACAGAAVIQGWSAARSRRALVRGALHVGAFSRTLGKRELELY
jgi:succinoglycan biosynthesis protein ExoM